MVTNKGRLERNSQFVAVAQRSIVPRVRDGHHYVRFDRMQPGQFPPHGYADLTDVVVADRAVRSRKIDKFEHAEGFALLLERPLRANAVIIDDHDLARLDFPDEFGVDQVKGARLRSEDEGIVQSPQNQRPKPEWIPHADNLFFAHQYEGKGSFYLADRFYGILIAARLSQEMQDDFAVNRRLKDRTTRFQFVTEDCRVDQVPVVRDRQLAPAAIDHQRLGVLQGARPGC